jgi:hypothetical protein
MALRIAVGLYAALRAVLVYGEAGQLATRPILVPRVKSAARPSLAQGAAAETLALPVELT